MDSIPYIHHQSISFFRLTPCQKDSRTTPQRCHDSALADSKKKNETCWEQRKNWWRKMQVHTPLLSTHIWFTHISKGVRKRTVVSPSGTPATVAALPVFVCQDDYCECESSLLVYQDGCVMGPGGAEGFWRLLSLGTRHSGISWPDCSGRMCKLNIHAMPVFPRPIVGSFVGPSEAVFFFRIQYQQLEPEFVRSGAI